MRQSSLRYRQGFTLLEILIAITLAAMVLGSVFVLQSQSKQLVFRSQTKIYESLELRAALNNAHLPNAPKRLTNQFHIANAHILEKPEEQSTAIRWQLEQFDLLDQQGNVMLSSIRFHVPQ